MKTEELFAKMNKTAKILCAIFAVIITAGLSYAIITYHPDYKTASDAFNVKALRVNYSDEPSAVSSDELTFGWQMDSDKVGISQTAYRIVVNDKSNFKGRTYWDSGKILSDRIPECRSVGESKVFKKRRDRWYGSGLQCFC